MKHGESFHRWPPRIIKQPMIHVKCNTLVLFIQSFLSKRPT